MWEELACTTYPFARAKWPFSSETTIGSPIEICDSVKEKPGDGCLLWRLGIKNDITETSAESFTLVAQQCPKFPSELHQISFFFGKKFIPLPEEVTITVVQMTNRRIKVLRKSAGLTIAILSELVVDEARSLRITPATLACLLQHRWKMISFADIARQAISHLEHLEKFMSNTTDAECS
jgi:hypothetical protein